MSEIAPVLTTTGVSVPSLGGRLFCSSRDPHKEARSWLQLQLPFLKNSNQVLLLGLGAGFHLQEILSSPFCPQQLLVVEKEESLVRLWKDSQVSIEVCPWVKLEFLSTRRPLSLSSPSDILVLEFRPAWKGNEDFYQDLVQDIRGPTIKEILRQVPSLDQSKSAKIWRALQELVR